MTYHAMPGHAVHFLDCADVRGGHGFSEVHPRKRNTRFRMGRSRQFHVYVSTAGCQADLRQYAGHRGREDCSRIDCADRIRPVANEVRLKFFKSTIQTIVYLPHFMSWVVLGTMLTMIFSFDGMINNFLEFLGLERIMFLASNDWFRPLIVTDTWKEFGYGTIWSH